MRTAMKAFILLLPTNLFAQGDLSAKSDALCDVALPGLHATRIDGGDSSMTGHVALAPLPCAVAIDWSQNNPKSPTLSWFDSMNMKAFDNFGAGNLNLADAPSSFDSAPSTTGQGYHPAAPRD